MPDMIWFITPLLFQPRPRRLDANLSNPKIIMCNFKSAIVLQDESVKGGFRLLMSPWTESHSELETIFKLKADARLSRAKVEFTPESMDKAYLPETYKLTIDQERTPDWFDGDMQEAVSEKMRDYVKSIIVSGNVELLIGGQFIIAPGAKVECAKAMVIAAICGGTVSEICGGTVSEIRGGTVSAIYGGTVSQIRGGTVSEIYGGTVQKILKCFDGILGKVTKPGKIVEDER